MISGAFVGKREKQGGGGKGEEKKTVFSPLPLLPFLHACSNFEIFNFGIFWGWKVNLVCYTQLESLKLSMDFVDTKEPDTKKSLTAQVISVMGDIIYRGGMLWNSLPNDIKASESKAIFKRKLASRQANC